MRTVIIKMSGEALAGGGESILSDEELKTFSRQLERGRQLRPDLRIGIVVGGGNILRGKDYESLGEVRSHQMGMLATVINGMAVQAALTREGVDARLMSAIDTRGVAEPMIFGRALKHLERGRMIVFAGGTGNPYATTDSAAALRARELGASALLVAKNGTQGVFDMDPRENVNANFLPHLTYKELIDQRLEVMDLEAVHQCETAGIPIHVFDIDRPDALYDALVSENPGFGTMIDAGGTAL